MQINAKFEYKDQQLGKTDRNYCMLSIKAPAMNAHTARKPLNIAVVIDRSGSMQGEKLAAVKRAVKNLVNNLANNDILSIISYNRKAVIVREAGKVFNKQQIISRVNKIYASGRTNLSAGWQLGFNELSEHLSDKYINRIILLTDGLANEGITKNSKLSDLGRKFREKGVRTTCMGVGDDFNEALLTKIADESNGNYYYMDDSSKIQEFFREEIGELLNLVAQDIELSIEIKNGVRLRRILTDYSMNKTGEDEYTFVLDDAYSSDEKIILLRLDYPAVHQPHPYEIITCKLKYKNLIENSESSDDYNVLRNVSDDKEVKNQVPDEEVLKNVALFIAAAARKQSYEQHKTGKTDLASQTLFSSSAELSGIAESLDKINSEFGKIVRLESQSLETDKSKLESVPDKASKDILFKSRSSFRQKSEYKKQKHETDVYDDDPKEGII